MPTLADLGLDEVPARRPLAYPGRPVTAPALLTGDGLVPLAPRPGRLGGWEAAGRTLDETLASLGQAVTGARFPVLAVGSNASPAQLTHKLGRLGLPVAVPMVPTRVTGLGVGCSGHISAPGYVATAPYADPGASATLVVSWLDAAQFTAVDNTEFPHYRRALLPGDGFPLALPSGERLAGAYAYHSAFGVLADPAGGRPLAGGGDQAALLASLLARSARLRALLGPGPREWVRAAAADPDVRAAGTRILAEEGWVLPESGLLPFTDDTGTLRPYNDPRWTGGGTEGGLGGTTGASIGS